MILTWQVMVRFLGEVWYALTLKKARVDPDSRQPYLILVCLARSSADSIGDSILSTIIRYIGQKFISKESQAFTAKLNLSPCRIENGTIVNFVTL